MLKFQGETSLLLRGNGNIRIPFLTKQGNRPSSQVEEGENGALLELWHETRCSSGVDRYLGDLSELHQGFQVPFRVSRGNVGFLLRHWSGIGSHLALRAESRGCSWVAAGLNPGDSNPGEANPGDYPHFAASVVSFPGHFSGHLAHICVHTLMHTCTHTHTQRLCSFSEPGNSHFKSTREALQW